MNYYRCLYMAPIEDEGYVVWIVQAASLEQAHYHCWVYCLRPYLLYRQAPVEGQSTQLKVALLHVEHGVIYSNLDQSSYAKFLPDHEPARKALVGANQFPPPPVPSNPPTQRKKRS